MQGNQRIHLSYIQFVIKHSLLLVALFALLLAGCGGDSQPSQGQASPTSTLPSRQVLRLPNVGIGDSGSLDPALGPDNNTSIIINMLYSGLVRTSKDLEVLPDQATWDISANGKTYTFHLQPTIKFSDGTPITANTYVYSWTRALLPAVKSPVAKFFEGRILGADAVSAGKSTVLKGVKAINASTLQVTLTQPTPYFLAELTNSVFFPVNKQMIDQYGQSDWPVLR